VARLVGALNDLFTMLTGSPLLVHERLFAVLTGRPLFVNEPFFVIRGLSLR